MLVNSALYLLEENAAVKGKLKTAFLVNPTLTSEEFLEAVLDEFEVSCPTTSKPRRLAAFHQMLLLGQQQGGTAILVVDEAHLLSPAVLEEIRLLGNMESYQEKLLQIVLSGQPELQDHLRQPNMRALRQRIAVSCHLRPLSLLETQVYVLERLHVAGLQGDSPFSDMVLQQIFAHTSGVPRLINLLCDSTMAIASSQHKRAVDGPIVEEAVAKLDPWPEQVDESIPENLVTNGAGHAGGLEDYRPMAEIEEFRSAVDLLIHAMKRNRIFAEE
jgi:general secretion pathway protein A